MSLTTDNITYPLVPVKKKALDFGVKYRRLDIHTPRKSHRFPTKAGHLAFVTYLNILNSPLYSITHTVKVKIVLDARNKQRYYYINGAANT